MIGWGIKKHTFWRHQFRFYRRACRSKSRRDPENGVKSSPESIPPSFAAWRCSVGKNDFTSLQRRRPWSDRHPVWSFRSVVPFHSWWSVKFFQKIPGEKIWSVSHIFTKNEKVCGGISKSKLFEIFNIRGKHFLHFLCWSNSGGRKMNLIRVFEKKWNFTLNFEREIFLFRVENNSWKIQNLASRIIKYKPTWLGVLPQPGSQIWNLHAAIDMSGLDFGYI